MRNGMSLRAVLVFSLALAILGLAAAPAQALSYYWDTDSPIETAGFGTASGTWGTDSFWSASSAGTDSSGILTPTIGDDLNFGYLTTSLAAGTVTVTGTVNAQSLTFASGSGAIVLSGGTAINLAAAATITVDNATNTIDSILTGAATSLTKAGTGVLTLSGTNTFTGQLTVGAGRLNINAGTVAMLNVPAGRADLNSPATATTANVSGTGLLALNSTVSTLNVTGGTVNVGSAARAGTATLSAGTVNAGTNALAVTNTLQVPGLTATWAPTVPDTAFLASGGNVGATRTLTLTGGTMTLEGQAAPTGGLSYYTISDADFGGISSSNTYSHAIDFGNNGGAPNINGVQFVKNFGGAGGSATQNTGSQDAGNQHPGGNEGNFTNTVAYPGTTGLGTLYNDFNYNASPNNIVLTNLTPDKWYDLRMYQRTWGNPGDNRTQQFDFIIGGASTPQTTVNYNEDNPGASWAAASSWTPGDAYAMGYIYQADSAGKITLKATQSGAGTYHIYGMTNQEVDLPPGGDFSTTNFAVTATSTLALPALDCTLGTVTLVGNSQLTLSGATKVSVAGLAGTGSVASTVTVASGGMVSPGTDTTISTISATGLTLDSGSFLTFNITDTTTLDRVNVTGAGGLTIDGGGITLLNSDGTDPFSTVGGPYNLISYVGTLGGDVANLSVVNRVNGVKYTFDATGSFIRLTTAVGGYWMGGDGTDQKWSNADNWNGIPIGNGDVLSFVEKGSGLTTLDNDIENGSYASLQFEDGAPDFTLNSLLGYGITLNGDGPDKVIIVNNSTAKQIVNLDITLGADAKINAAAGDIEVGGDITGAYSLTKTGPGTLTLSGATNAYNGTIINAGILRISGGADRLPTGTAVTLANVAGAALDLNGNNQTIASLAGGGTTGGNVTLGSGTLTVSSAASTTFAGIVSGNGGSLVKSGAGTLTLGGANSFTGQLTVQDGTLSIASINNVSAPGPLGNSALAVILGNTGAQTGTLQYTGGNASSTKTFTLATGGTGAIEVTTGATNLTLSGAIGGAGGLTKTGAGILTLSGTNTFDGATTVNSGTLQLATVGAFNNIARAVTVNSGGTVMVSASNAANGATFTINSGGLLTATSILNAYSGSTINLNGGTLVYNASTTTPNPRAVGGNIAVSANSMIQSQYGTNGRPAVTWQYGTLDFTQDGYQLEVTELGGSNYQPATMRSKFVGSTISHSGTIYVHRAYEDAGSVTSVEMNNTAIRAGKTLTITRAGTTAAYVTGSLGVAMLGGAELLGSNSFNMINASAFTTTFTDTSTFDTTAGLWAKSGTTTIAATLDNSKGSTAVGGSGVSFTAEDAAYVSLTGLTEGSKYDLFLELAVPANLATVMDQLGKNPDFSSVTSTEAGKVQFKFTAPAETAYFAWDNVHNTAADWYLGGDLTYVGLSSSAVLGDTNGDKVVDAADYIAIKTNFGLSGLGITRLQGDLVDNDVVDWDDLQVLMGIFSTRSVGEAPAAPEPCSAMLLMFGAAALLRRRRAA